ncbi:MAG: L-aspartate oxidase [Phycisphaeraceae bacterium]|nr:L-aspartate oxidase [Phycisphaeraceae bacterium]MCW5755433.1 L-aspartate oxidase [Phycisphaeraceae bacterium]MCW5769956.1 L-aspartate oxidase [Phycisphaeraceae bacterium]
MDPLLEERRYLIPFRSSLLPQIFTDTLVIGSGVAGMRAAIAASGHGEVIVLAKGALRNTNTAWAQGGVAVVLGESDSFASHIADTHAAGAGLCDDGIVRRVVEGGPSALEELLSWGLRVDREADGTIARGREGGHSESRIVHRDGDATGRAISECLHARMVSTANVRVFEGCFALDLLTPSRESGSPVMGAITHHPRYGLQIVWAKATIVATGGAGVLYRETTNPPEATADGQAMAYRAGATLSDMAFMQFHPTTLYLPGAHRALITEAIRGEGAVLLDASHHRFMPEVHELGDLAPRDIVSRAIVQRIARQGGRHVWLDCRGVTDFAGRFPGIARTLAQFDLDGSKDLIPVHPAAHYMIGGVRTDAFGRSDVPGLYAAGEAACTGLHGANRLASNSLLEGLVTGAMAGEACAEMLGASNAWGVPTRSAPAKVISDIPTSDHGELDLDDVRSSLRSAMWRNVGIERTGAKLNDVRDMFDFWSRYTLDKIFDEPEGWEVQNMLLTGALIARSAAWREESRGCHWRDDFPAAREEFRVHDGWKRGMDTPRAEAVLSSVR